MTEFDPRLLEELFQGQSETDPLYEAQLLTYDAQMVIKGLFADERPLSGYYGPVRPGIWAHELDESEYESLARYYERFFARSFLHNITTLNTSIELLHAIEESTIPFEKEEMPGEIRYVARDHNANKHQTMEIVQTDWRLQINVKFWDTDTEISEGVEAVFTKLSGHDFSVQVTMDSRMQNFNNLIHVAWVGIAHAQQE